MKVRSALLVMTAAMLGFAIAPAPMAVAATIPAPPSDVELHAGADSSITISWDASAGATGYRIYRGTAAGGEGTTPIATVTTTSYKDPNLSPTPVYFYQVTAVNSAGESARTAEDASKTPPPIGTGGDVAGTPSGNGKVYYCKDALLGGFDWFQTLNGWFPSVLGSSGSASPGQRVVDMAYAKEGTMTFNNVVVPTAGLYTVDWRYAFQGGLFPAVKNRQMGLKVNGAVITSTQSFPITGSFDVYQHSFLQVQLRAGVNSITQFAVSDHGLSRVDQMTVSPATASVPSGPTNLRATPGGGSVALAWTAGSGSTSYSVYRGTASDGESPTAISTTTGSTFTDTGLTNGKTYFYFVQGFNPVGGSPNSNEVSAVPGGAATPPAAPGGLVATAGDGSVSLTWNASAGATSYSVYRGTAVVGTTASPSFTDTGLTNGTTYSYKVTASNAAGTSPASATVNATPTAGGNPPGVPFGVVITPRTGDILLQWGFQAGVTSYHVFRSTTPGGETLLVTVTSPTYVDRAVVPGTTYYYQISALIGAAESARTREFSATALS
jgi:fibronectin type 3 domain-containing protein